MEWVWSEENTLADELSNLLITDGFAVSRTHFQRMERRFGPHSIDLFASGANILCDRFYSLHWYTGSRGVNAFAYDQGGGSGWIHCPYRILGRVLEKAGARRGDCDDADPVVGVRHMVATRSAGRGTLC